MHEMGIASAVLEAVRAETRRLPDGHICKVGVRIGELAESIRARCAFVLRFWCAGPNWSRSNLRLPTVRAAVNAAAVDMRARQRARSRRVRTAARPI